MSTYHPTKHLMKKRLSSWGNFFDKIQQQALSGGLNEEAESESEDFDYNDKLFKAVEEEHCSVRRSLYSEFDVSEYSTESEVDNDLVKDTNRKLNENSVEGFLLEKDCVKASKDPNPKRNKNTVEGFLSDEVCVKASKDPNPKRNKNTVEGFLSDEVCVKASKDPNPKSSNKTKERFLSDKGCVKASKALSLMSLGERISPKKSASLKIAEKTDRLKRQSSLPENLSCRRFLRVEKNDDFWKQYEVWKIYRRRKRGKLGSVFIVSNLDEEPSEENRFIPSFPSDIKKPNFGPRRFILKR